MCRWTLLEETRKEAISLIPGLVPHHQHILIMTDIRIFTECLRFCFMNKLNPSKKEVSLSCFRRITVLTKFKFCATALPTFPKKMFWFTYLCVLSTWRCASRSWAAVSHGCSPVQNKIVCVLLVFVARAEHCPGTQVRWHVWRHILVAVGMLLSSYL